MPRQPRGWRGRRAREDAVREREDKVRRRLDAKVDDHLREARREIDAVIDGLKTKAAAMSEQAAVRLKSGERLRAAGLSTGDMGAVKAGARAALDQIADRVKGTESPAAPAEAPSGPIEVGSRVTVGALGLEGVVIEFHGKHAEVDVRGKRLRAALRDLRIIEGSAAPPRVNVSVDLQPDRKSTRLNSSHSQISYAVFCLKKKKKTKKKKKKKKKNR